MTRHRRCLVDILDNVMSSTFIRVALWVCMRPGDRVVLVGKVLVAQDRPQQDRIFILSIRYYCTPWHPCLGWWLSVLLNHEWPLYVCVCGAERRGSILPMLWRDTSGIMGYDFRSLLLGSQGTLRAQHYVSDILRPHAPWYSLSARQTVSCGGPPSHIEHMWVQLGHQHRASANLQDLKGQLQQLWADLSQHAYTACIQARRGWGCHTLLAGDQ